MNSSVGMSNTQSPLQQMIDSLNRTAQFNLDEFLRWIHQNPRAINFIENSRGIDVPQSVITNYIADTERKIIQSLTPQNQQTTSTDVFLISAKWWRLWADYTNFEGKRRESNDDDPYYPPGPIDNNDLIRNNTGNDLFDLIQFPLLKPNLAENSDFVFVTRDVWERLVNWYGGGPMIKRQLVFTTRDDNRNGDSKGKSYKLDLYPLIFDIGLLESRKVVGKCISSSSLSFQNFVIVLARQLSTDTTLPYSLYTFDADCVNLIKCKTPEITTLEECGLAGNQAILLGPFQTEAEPETAQQTITRLAKAGNVGIHNLTNTCYLAAVLQALGSCELLTEYLLSERFNKEVSALRKKGTPMLDAYIRLLEKLWYGNAGSAIVPREIYTEIVKKNSMFGDMIQHDAAELYTCLRDTLQEEMNVNQERPKVTDPDFDGKISDKDFASIYWMNYLEHENSMTTNLTQGQYKQHLYCKDCGYESVRFHTYDTLHLALNRDDSQGSVRSLKVNVVLLSRRPIQASVRVKNDGTINDLMHALRKVDVTFASCNFIFADIQSNYVFSTLRRTKPLSEIRDSDIIIAYEYDKKIGMKRSESCMTIGNEASPVHTATRVNLVHRRLKEEKRLWGKNETKAVLFGIPLIIAIPHVHGATFPSGKILYQTVAKRIEENFEFQIPASPEILKSPSSKIALRNKSIPPPEFSAFTLKFVERTGAACSRCGGLNGCLGCKIENTDSEIQLHDNETIAIEWARSFRSSRGDLNEVFGTFDLHPSVEKNEEDEASLPPRNLDDLLQEFATSEEWYCSKCKVGKGCRRDTIWRFPPILVVQIKRFQYSPIQQRFVKNSRIVKFPMELEVSKYQSPNVEYHRGIKPTAETANAAIGPSQNSTPHMYDLFATVNHLGSYEGGHYLAVTRQIGIKSPWVIYNDENAVTEVDENVLTNNDSAYLLYYVKRDTTLDSVRNESMRLCQEGAIALKKLPKKES
ncbi:hypothetical protein BKA69DRAFT_155670 [Paraphysoderma sedebokerense]|nr:hypothetical protein BKA69DRAFT_155670 [Paraphysoderma sedebokerense]